MLLGLVLGLCLCGAGGGQALAAPQNGTQTTSAEGMQASASQASDNWAGYAVTSSKAFRRVTGAWIQPSVSCEGSAPSAAAFWIGIGGFSKGSQALEQIGTESDCAAGRSLSYAWYELLPAGSVTLRLKIHPGDHMSASVTVRGKKVTVRLADNSTGKSFAKTLRMSAPDTSSAEWIAEAPSVCVNGSERCLTLPLADFSSISFSDAEATPSGGSAVPADSPSFHLTEVTLRSAGVPFGRFGHTIAGSLAAQATPGALASSGSAFTITWEQPTTPTTPSPAEQPGFLLVPSFSSARPGRAPSGR